MRLFQPEDLQELNAWYQKRSLPTLSEDLVPSIGLIEPNVAAGFAYHTDSSLVFLDGYVSNPLAPISKRAEALKGITEGLLGAIQGRRIVALCKAKSIERLAKKHSFLPIGTYVMMAKER